MYSTVKLQWRYIVKPQVYHIWIEIFSKNVSVFQYKFNLDKRQFLSRIGDICSRSRYQKQGEVITYLWGEITYPCLWYLLLSIMHTIRALLILILVRFITGGLCYHTLQGCFTGTGVIIRILGPVKQQWRIWTNYQSIPPRIGNITTTKQSKINHVHSISIYQLYAHGFVFLCFGYEFMWSIKSYPSGLLHWHWGNHTIAPVPVK